MTVSRLLRLCLVLILAHSTLGTFPYPYPQFQPSLPLTTHLIYNVPIDGRAADLAGFSYFAKDLGNNGGHSEVVFVTGPNSDAQMNDEIAAMKDQLGLPAPASDSTKSTTDISIPEKQNPEDSKEVETSQKKSDASEPASLAPTENKETPISAPKDESDQGIINGQLIPEQAFALRAPYPILRLRGSSSYYPQSVGGFPGYEPLDYFKSKYDPFYEPHGSYQTLYHPFYSALDDYYNRLAPFSYSSPPWDPQLYTPSADNFIPGGSLPELAGPTQGSQEITPKITPKIGAEETEKISSEKPDTKAVKNSAVVESPVTDGADSEKKPELSVSTEQSSESGSTPVSAIVSSTEETSMTGASSTEDDTATVEITA